MKCTFLSLAAFLLLAGCSGNDSETNDLSNASQLGIHVGISPSSVTRSIVNGTAFKAPAAIGIYVAQGASGDASGNKGAIGVPYSEAANNVKFSLSGTAWTPERRVSLSAATGTVYAYYPHNASSTITASTPNIPVTIASTGTITVSSGSGATAGVNNAGTIVTPVILETDYMFYDPSTSASDIKPKVVVNNHNADPSLVMHHALAKVSFRVIKNGSYSNGGAEGHLTRYVVADNATKNLITTGGTLTMSLIDGTITQTTPTTGSITRDIQGYTLGSDAATATIISNLVIPIASFGASDLKVTFTIDGIDYQTVLPTTAIQYWNAGNNYLYTVTLSGTDLNINSVEIIDWNPVNGGDIAIQ